MCRRGEEVDRECRERGQQGDAGAASGRNASGTTQREEVVQAVVVEGRAQSATVASRAVSGSRRGVPDLVVARGNAGAPACSAGDDAERDAEAALPRLRPSPCERSPRAQPYQSPSPATASPTSSFVARRAPRDRGTPRDGRSRSQTPTRQQRAASATGWNSSASSHCAGEEEVREAKPSPAGPPRCRARASRRAARRARSRRLRRRAAARGSATAARAAREPRIGSTWTPSRVVWSPVSFVTSSGSPCAVDQTACAMFPRSKRPVENERCRRTASARNRRRSGDGRGERPAQRARSRSSAPALAEDPSLAAVGRGQAAGGDRAVARRRWRADATRGERQRVAGGTSSALSPSTSSSRAAACRR